MVGKQIRISSWLKNNKTFLIALDEIIPKGLNPNVKDFGALISELATSPIDGLVLHPGIAMRYGNLLAGRCPWIAKLTTNSNLVSDKNDRVVIGSLQQALSLGASGIAVNVFLGKDYEKNQLNFLAKCVEEGNRWGMPVIAFMSPPDNNEFDPNSIAYACRVGTEIGADFIKANYTGSSETFKDVIRQTLAPVIIEYSPLPETTEGTLETVRGSLAAGASGVHFGNCILNNPNQIQLVKSIAELIHQNPNQ